MHARYYARLFLLSTIAILLLLLSIEGATRVTAQQGVITAQPVNPVLPARFNGDVRRLPAAVPYVKWDRETHPDPSLFKLAIEPADGGPVESNKTSRPSAAMPAPVRNFAGLSRADLCGVPPSSQCGAGTPPDTNGDVGLNQYIESVNTAIGIYSKNGTLQASFTFNQLWASVSTGTPCDTLNQGDPVVIYDQMADRWIVTDFAFASSGTVAPYYQCFAVSQTSDPLAGGWFLYALRTDDAAHPWLNDYPKFGLWPDGIYMAINGFDHGGAFSGTEAWALNRYDLESGLPLRAFVAYVANTLDPFSMLPSNLRGNVPGSLPPAGTPNYFVSESQTAFTFEVRKFQVSPTWTSATFSAATNVAQTSYTVPATNIVVQPGTTVTLDSLGDRLMQKVQYRKIGGVESLWVTHSFSTTLAMGSQWAQINVTGATINTTPVQQQKYDPADGVYRWMSSIAADSAGNAALGYSVSSAGVNPGVRYSGRLAADALNLLPQTETVMQAGVGVQNGSCGGPCHRWGDYSAMAVDPADDCTFWFTSEYYSTAGASTIAWDTRIGAFRFSPAQCVSTPVTLTNHSLIFDGGVGSDWSPVSERLGTSGAAPNTFDYFLTWDSANLYAGMKGLSNTMPYTFALVIDTDPATQSPSNTGSAAALACAGGFNANAKGNFALVRGSANTAGVTGKFQSSGGAWAAWAPGSSSDALDYGRNMAEFQVKWSDVGLSAPAGTAGVYLYVCQGSTLVSAWPPEDLQSGSPALNVETVVPLNDTARTPRTYSPHAGQETATVTNGAGPFNLLNGYVRLAKVSGLGGACSFTATDGGNLTAAPAAQMAQRTYTLSPGAGCGGLTADVTLKYEDGTTANNAPSEIYGLTESSITLLKNVSGAWVDQGGTVNTAANTVTRLAVNNFSQWGFGTSHPTAVSVTNVSAESETGYGVWLVLGLAALGAIVVVGLKRRTG